MMKSIEFRPFSSIVGLAALCAVLGFASSATALPLGPIPSEAILMIDGKGDGDGVVDVTVFDTGTDFHFGYYDGGFQQILAASSIMTTMTFNGGDVVDFAIQNASDSTIHRLSDGNATLVFTGALGAGVSENPIVPFEYWESVSITWTAGNNDFVVGLGGGDGLAPGSLAPMPEPSAALSFAVGFALVGWRIRRRPRA